MAALDIHQAFHDIDGHGGGAAADAYLTAVHSSPIWLEARRRRLAANPIKPGMRVLDGGCGSGHDLAWLAEAVTPSGSIVGFDFSQDLLDRASERAATLDCAIELVRGDLHELPFPEASFDAVWIERVIMYLERPRDVAKEILRVLKPGGVLVSGEIDLTSAWMVSSDDAITALVQERQRKSIRNPGLARLLPTYCVMAAFSPVQVEPVTWPGREFDNWAKASNILWHLEQLAVENKISAADAEKWIADMKRLAESGSFCAVVTIVNLIATKPAGARV